MKILQKSVFTLILFFSVAGFSAPVLDTIGVSTVQTVSAQNADVDQAGEKIRTSVIQLIKLVYDKLRLPVSLLAAVVAIGIAMIYRRRGIPAMVGIFGFIFLWAFAPVIVNFLIGLAGGGGPIQIN